MSCKAVRNQRELFASSPPLLELEEMVERRDARSESSSGDGTLEQMQRLQLLLVLPALPSARLPWQTSSHLAAVGDYRVGVEDLEVLGPPVGAQLGLGAAGQGEQFNPQNPPPDRALASSEPARVFP
eukprot:215957-Hanusia_phi.AAC.1